MDRWMDGGREGMTACLPGCLMIFISYCCCPAGVIVPLSLSQCLLIFPMLMYREELFGAFFFPPPPFCREI